MDKRKADGIIKAYFKKIYGFAVKKSFLYEEAEELCSQMVLEVYSSLLKSDDVYNIEGYIWRICEYTYVNYLRREKRQQGISIDSIDIPYYDDNAFDISEDESLTLRREIAFLTENRRLIVYRYYYENRSVSEISNTMGIPEGTVKWHLSKARHELKEGFQMERKIGKLGLSPLKAVDFGHDGQPGEKGGPEVYLEDRINLNIVYSVYRTPRNKQEIAEELGLTLVFIEDKIDLLESNGFLIPTADKKYTTRVCFSPEHYSLELMDKKLDAKLKIAHRLAAEYVPAVRDAVNEIDDVYVPGGNRELFEATAIYASIVGIFREYHPSPDRPSKSKYFIKTTDGGNYIAYVHLDSSPCDPEYKLKNNADYESCGSMTRGSDKYPGLFSWSVDSRFSSRKGYWQNNLSEDYEYLYEYFSGIISDDAASRDKFKRLRDRGYLSENNEVNVIVVKGSPENFEEKLPRISNNLLRDIADTALEVGMAEAKFYPAQMQDLIVCTHSDFISNTVAMMVMDILYSDGTFALLSEKEKITANLLMFSDTLPNS